MATGITQSIIYGGICMKRLLKILVEMVLFCYVASAAFALEVAPRLTDREIIESLAELKQGQRDINKRFDDLQIGTNKRFDDLRMDMNKRMDTSHRTMLALFGMLITLIVALFGYIAWDRRTLVKPIQEKLNIIEQNRLFGIFRGH